MTWFGRCVAWLAGGSSVWLYLAVGLAVFSAGWVVNGWRWEARQADLVAEYDAVKDKAVQDALDLRDQQAASYAKIDEFQYGKLSDEQKITADLRAAVAVGDKRLRVEASCPASAKVSEDHNASGMDHGGAAELSPGARSAYFDLRTGLQTVTRQLKACQAIVRSQMSSNP